jgi:hypothetical protein
MSWKRHFKYYGSLLFLCGAGMLAAGMFSGLFEYTPKGMFGWSSWVFYVTFPIWHTLALIDYRMTGVIASLYHAIAAIFMCSVSWSCVPDEIIMALPFLLWAIFHFLFAYIFLKPNSTKAEQPAHGDAEESV